MKNKEAIVLINMFKIHKKLKELPANVLLANIMETDTSTIYIYNDNTYVIKEKDWLNEKEK